jgi:predicted protein tyrosine phosphatase
VFNQGLIMFIENVAAADIPRAHHYDPGPNSMLISICDPAGWRPEARYPFKERHDFEFLDIDDSDLLRGPELGEFAITEQQAEDLVALLKRAWDQHMNVIVHCTVGVCRSGAVVEVGVAMGFEDTGRFRAPNLRVKALMMRAAGLVGEDRSGEDDEG